MCSLGALITFGILFLSSVQFEQGSAFQWLSLPKLPCIEKAVKLIVEVTKISTQSVPKEEQKTRIESVLVNCPSGYSLKGKTCVKVVCPSADFELINGQCKAKLPTCNENQIRIEFQCHDKPEKKCQPGFQFQNNACVAQCESGFKFEVNRCVKIIIVDNTAIKNECPPYFKQEGSTCVKLQCPKFSRIEGNDCVKCPSGQQGDGTKCVDIIPQTCANQLINGFCLDCQPGFERKGDTCVLKACEDGFKRVGIFCQKILQCEAGWEKHVENNTEICRKVVVECGQHYVRSGSNQCVLKCEDGYQLIDNQCIKIIKLETCPPNYKKIDQDKCIRSIQPTCPNDFVLVESKLCVQKIVGVKECPPKFKLDNNNTCTLYISATCPDDFFFNNTECVKKILIKSKCPDNYEEYNNACIKKEASINCPPNYTKVNNTCVRQQTVYENCPTGFVLLADKKSCEKIQEATECPKGYKLYGLRSCLKIIEQNYTCPDGYKILENNKCIRKVNETTEIIKATIYCPNDYILNNQSLCEKIINRVCPSGHLFKDNLCVQHILIGSCPDGYIKSLTNKETCERRIDQSCQEGYTLSKEGECVKELLLPEKITEKPDLILCPQGYIARKYADGQQIKCVRIIPKCPKNYLLTTINNASICRLRQCAEDEISHLVEGNLTCFRRPANECQAGFHYFPEEGKLVCKSNGNRTCPIGTQLVKGIKSDYCEKIICETDFVLVDGKCIKNLLPPITKCKSGYIRINNECVEKSCPSGFSLRTEDYHSVCTINGPCPEGYRKINSGSSNIEQQKSVCIRVNCLDGYKLIGFKCVKIAKNCSKDEIMENGKCKSVCPKDHERRFGVCFPLECPAGFKRNGEQCIKEIELGQCRPGFQLIGKNCERNCSAGFVQKDDVCLGEVCKEGFSLKGTICVLNNCPEDMIRQGNYCYKNCSQGYVQIGNVCVSKETSCPTDFVMIGSTCYRKNCPEGFEKINQTCVKKCPEGFIPDETHLKCIGNSSKCPNNYISKPNSEQCVKESCREDETLYQGICYRTLPCPLGYKFNGVTCEQKITMCPVGYLKLNDKHCVKFTVDCPKGEYAHGEKCVKECPKNYILLNNRCQHSQIKCNDTSVNFDGQCLENCPNSFVKENGVCHECPEGSRALENKCIAFKYSCPSGYNRLGKDKCVQLCPDGYGLRHGYCLLYECPKGQEPQFDLDTKQITCQNAVNCASNKSLHENQCIDTCPAGLESFRTGLSQKLVCRKPCTKDETYFRGKCENTLCINKFKIQDTGKCESFCPDGYIGVGKECRSIQILSCPVGFILIKNKFCIRSCPAGYKSENNECRKIEFCTANDTLQFNNTCVKECPKDYKQRDRTCVQINKCDKDLIVFEDKCVERCPDTHYFDSETTTCQRKLECPKNFVRLSYYCVNQCPLGYRKEGNICQRSKHCLHGVVKSGHCMHNCPVGYRPVQGICKLVQFVCKYGQFLIQHEKVQTCVKQCPDGYESLHSERICRKHKKQCPPGYISQIKIDPQSNEAKFVCQEVQYCSDGYLQIYQRAHARSVLKPKCIKLQFPRCPEDTNIFIVKHNFYCLKKTCSKEYKVSDSNCSSEHCPQGFYLKSVGINKFCHRITSEGYQCPINTKRTHVYTKNNQTTVHLGFVCLKSNCQNNINGTCENEQKKHECPGHYILVDNGNGQKYCQLNNKTKCQKGFKAIFNEGNYTCQDSLPSCPAGFSKKYFTESSGILAMVCLEEKCLNDTNNFEKCEKRCPENYNLQTSKSGRDYCQFTCPANSVKKLNWSWIIFSVGAKFVCETLPPCPRNLKNSLKPFNCLPHCQPNQKHVVNHKKDGNILVTCSNGNRRSVCQIGYRMHKYIGKLFVCLPQNCSAQHINSTNCGPNSAVCPKIASRVVFEKDMVACKIKPSNNKCPIGSKAVEEISANHKIIRRCVSLPKALCQSNEKQILTYFLNMFHFICLDEKCRHKRTTKEIQCQGACPDDYEKQLFAPQRYFCVRRPKPLCPQGMSWLIKTEKSSNSSSCMKVPGPSCPREYNRFVYQIKLDSLSPFFCLNIKNTQKVLSQNVTLKPEEILCPQGFEPIDETAGNVFCKPISLHPNCPPLTRQIIMDKNFYCLPVNCSTIGSQCNATCPEDYQLSQSNNTESFCTKKPSQCNCNEVLFNGKCITKPDCGEESKLVILQINNELKFKCEERLKVCEENKIYLTNSTTDNCQLSCDDVINPSLQRKICLPQPSNQCVCRPGYASLGSRCVEPHKCARYAPIDMVFVIEGNSEQVTENEFSMTKSFISQFLTGFSISTKAVRVGVVVSGQNPLIVVNTHEITSKVEFFELLVRLSLKNSSKDDNIIEALQIATNILLSQDGGARSGVHKLLYLFSKNKAALSIDKQNINGVQVVIINLPGVNEVFLNSFETKNVAVKFVSLNNTNAVEQVTEITEKHTLCPLGYKSDNGNCLDINECLNTNTCVNNSLCVNTPGKYVCFCKNGLRYDNTVGCTDKEFCAIKTCQRGYKLNNENVCVDIDECEEKVCFDDGKCTNFEGGFNCTCTEKRKRYNKNFGCLDIDECKENPNLCIGNAQCTSLPSSYKCTCKEGYYYNSTTGCVDINECVSSSPCRDNSICINEPGNFRCDCGAGMTYVKDKCVDIDECQLETKVCSGTAICMNKNASFECVCPTFYLHYKGQGCVLDKEFARREADFVFVVDSSQTASPIFKSVTTMLKNLILKYNENQGLGLDARVAVIQMSENSSTIPLGFEAIDKVPNRIEALNLLGGKNADIQIGLDRAAELLKSKGRQGASFITFLITSTELPLRGEKLEKIISTTKDLKTNGQLLTIHINKDAAIGPWGIIYKESEIRRYVYIIQYQEIISSLSSLLYENTIQMIQCPANYVKQDGICKVQVELGTYCQYSVGDRVDLRPLGSQWTDRCSIYKCDNNGVNVVQHKCLGYDAKCYDLSVPNSGKSVYFPCMQVGGQLNWKCRCVLANNSLVYESITWKEDNIETKDGKKCVFPFLYENQWRYGCQPYDEEMWCSHERDYSVNRKWSYCQVKRALNMCTDPFTGTVYEEDIQWSVVRNGEKSCDQMMCTKNGAKKIPRCQSSTNICQNLGVEQYACYLDNGRLSDKCLCSMDSNGWGKNEDIGGSKSVSVGTEGSELIRTCFDVSTQKKFNLNSTWDNECFTYRCDLSGATTLSMKCKGQDNICYSVGSKNFTCTINNEKYENCACDQSTSGNPVLVTAVKGQIITMENKKMEYKLTATQVNTVEEKSQNIVKSSNA